ncbi:hypothetical protein Tco_0201149 [Tanacetum coccineum]
MKLRMRSSCDRRTKPRAREASKKIRAIDYFRSEPHSGELTSIVDIRVYEKLLINDKRNLTIEDRPISSLGIFLIARIFFEASRARGFVLRSQELHILNFILGIHYPNLID